MKTKGRTLHLSRLQNIKHNTYVYLVYRNILEFLIVEGHIYTTHDDDHFRCTEN